MLDIDNPANQERNPWEFRAEPAAKLQPLIIVRALTNS
jgi:hypothetical protein